MFHAVIMPFRVFLGKFSLKQTAIISRYTSAFQRELHDYFSLSLNKNQNQHPKHRAKNQWKKRNCFVGKMMITDNPLRFRSGAGFPYIIIQNLAAVFREFFFLILILMSAPLIPLPIKKPNFYHDSLFLDVTVSLI